MLPKCKHSLPAPEDLLAGGGDARIVPDANGANKYGCFSVPHPEILAYGSCTASTISPNGHAAATRLYQRLEKASRVEADTVTYAREMARIRDELVMLCGLAALPAPDIIFGASGTDLHLFAAQFLRKTNRSLLVIMPEATETGGGVPAALHGCHFSTCAALGGTVVQGEAIDHGDGIEVAVVPGRGPDGNLRPVSTVDAEVEALTVRAAKAGQHVLVVLTDVSKTGLIIPSPACALNLKRQLPAMVDVLVDACQFRLGNATLCAYLEQDFLVAVTGSKFVTGPAFSGALLVPQPAARRLRVHALPAALSAYSTRADWPPAWAGRETLPDIANFGLLLRWEAALAELRTFHSLSETVVQGFLETFASAVRQRLESEPAFEPLPTGKIDRLPLISRKTWDHIPTIFPFMLRQKSGALRTREETRKIYELLATEDCSLGQPVACGKREGMAISALRICADARLIVDACSTGGRGIDAVIAGAMRVLDKTADLAE